MEAIKLKLTQNEVGGLVRYLSALEETFDPAVLVLTEFRNYLLKRALDHKIRQKKVFMYTLPASVAVALWIRWQRQPIEGVLQLTLGQLDAVLTNRGIK